MPRSSLLSRALVAASAVLLVACADDAKRPVGASCESPAQCASGRCVDNVCVSPVTVTPPAVDTLHASSFKWSVEASPSVGRAYAGAGAPFGLRVSESTSGDGQFTLTGSDCVADAAIEGGGESVGFLRTFAWCNDGDAGEAIPYRATAEGFAIDRPASGPDDNPLGFSESEEASTLSFHALEGVDPLVTGGDVFIGQGPRSYVVESTTDGREVELIVAVRRAEGASVAAAAGDFGAVRYLVSAGVEGAGVVDVDVAAYGVELAAAANGGAEFRIIAGESVGYRHDALADVVTLHDVEDEAGFNVPITLAPDGALALEADVVDLRGALAPSGDFFYLGAGLPDPESAQGADGVVIDEGATEAQFEVMLGVRRAVAPDLAGKSYRVMRHEVVVGPGGFQIGLQRAGGTLVFDATGATATTTATIDRAEVTFTGTLTDGVDGPVTRTFDVSVDGGVGLIRLASQGGDGVAEAIGYAQVGERVLVLGDRVDFGGEGAIGLSVAVCTNCE